MEANELRIGNTITHQNNNGIYLVTVLETLKNGVNVKTNLQLGEWFLRHEEVQGTPLTEEWLLKFGFKKNERYVHNMHPWVDYTKSGIRIQLPFFTFNFGDEDEQDIDIQHVHQLQNLTFALTGKELVCI